MFVWLGRRNRSELCCVFQNRNGLEQQFIRGVGEQSFTFSTLEALGYWRHYGPILHLHRKGRVFSSTAKTLSNYEVAACNNAWHVTCCRPRLLELSTYETPIIRWINIYVSGWGLFCFWHQGAGSTEALLKSDKVTSVTMRNNWFIDWKLSRAFCHICEVAHIEILHLVLLF